MSSRSGDCSSATGVTVVVDFTDLGGGVVVRCAGSGGMNGIQALDRAGFTITGTQRQGLAFVCRIDGRPAADEKLAMDGDPGYTEQCVDTPPANAYWAYWYAADGGSWKYSPSGPASHQAVAGGYEGWRFELNRSSGPTPPPDYQPVKTPVSSSPSPTSAPTRTAASAPSPTPTPGPVKHHKNKPAAKPHSSTASRSTSAPSGTPAPGEYSTPSPTEAPVEPVSSDTRGSAIGAPAALGLIVLIALVAGGIAWRRSQQR